MRIIGGKLKGKTINPPAGYPARPTTDFAKEGLFNILESEYELEGFSLLDLFGGTGSISAEFISRGGKEAICVEMNRKNASFISFDFLDICNRTFDFIFADPPYKLEGIDTLPDKIFNRENPILSGQGYFILEHGADYDFSTHPHFIKERHYGNVHFSFFS